MDTIHLFEEGYYLIGNRSVAKCFLFKDETDCDKFKHKIEHHLSPLCDILAFCFLREEFKLVVKLKSRAVFEDYYIKKYGIVENGMIPESTYIFAQSMANLQSGYAKWFNFKYERDGGLMASRYSRKLIENETELDSLIALVNGLQIKSSRSRIWTFRRKEEGFYLSKIMRSVSRCSWEMYNNGGVERIILGFKLFTEVYLRGDFTNLPLKRLPNRKK